MRSDATWLVATVAYVNQAGQSVSKRGHSKTCMRVQWWKARARISYRLHFYLAIVAWSILASDRWLLYFCEWRLTGWFCSTVNDALRCGYPVAVFSSSVLLSYLTITFHTDRWRRPPVIVFWTSSPPGNRAEVSRRWQHFSPLTVLLAVTFCFVISACVAQFILAPWCAVSFSFCVSCIILKYCITCVYC